MPVSLSNEEYAELHRSADALKDVMSNVTSRRKNPPRVSKSRQVYFDTLYKDAGQDLVGSGLHLYIDEQCDRKSSGLICHISILSAVWVG